MGKALSRRLNYEIKFRKTNNPRWRAEPFKSDDLKELRQYIAKTITKHGRLNKGTYQLSFKYRGGYGKDNEEGRTMVVNWEGTAQKALFVFDQDIERIEKKIARR